MVNKTKFVMSKIMPLKFNKEISIGNIVTLVIVIISLSMFLIGTDYTSQGNQSSIRKQSEKIDAIQQEVNNLKIDQAVTNQRYSTIIESLTEIKQELKNNH